MKKIIIQKIAVSLLVMLLVVVVNKISAQPNKEFVSWKQVLKQDTEWYSSSEALRIASNVLIYQHETGGWPKNIDMASDLSADDDEEILKKKKDKKHNLGQPTMDNKATSTQLRFLAKIYESTKDDRFKNSILDGLNYLLDAQYVNGGWPQFYPIKKGYYEHITYNDNAMVNTMEFLREVEAGKDEFATLNIDEDLKAKLKMSFVKGIKCILKTQIIVDGEPTVWCAQHDKKTFAPAKARAYELPSFSGAESVGIVQLLMEIENPSEEVIEAVSGAAKWFEAHKIEGIRIEFTRINGERDREVIADENAPSVWARFYDLETAQPFFCDRDGIKKATLAEIGKERRGGYSWYTRSPQKILDKYQKWAKKWGVN